MATAYGNVVGPVLANGWRSVLVYTLTDNGTSVTVNTTLKMQLGSNYAMIGATVKGTTTIGSGSGSSSSKTITGTYNQSSLTTILTKSRTYTKTGSDQSIAISGAVTVGNGTSTASATVTIPKLTYRVTYSANGGDADSVPEAQTKIHNTTLVLSTTAPKRPGCSFLGWNTKADGSGTHYAAGGTYTGNAALSLYAVWLGASVPTIDAKRTDSGGIEADEGTYGTVAATWQAVGTPAASIAVTARNVTAGSTIALSGNTSGSKAVNKSASGSVSAIFGGSLSADVSYKVTVTVTVTATYNGATHTVTATNTAYVTYAYITLEGYKGGHGLAVGVAAHREGFDVQMTPFYSAEPIQHNTDGTFSGAANVITGNSGVATITGATAYRWGKVCQLAITWKNDSAISVPASGNITDVTVGTLVEGLRPAITAGGQSNGDNAGQAWYYVNASGTVVLGAVEGTGEARTIAAGTTFNMYAQLILP